MNNTLDLQLHYFIADIDSHVMDAKIHNEAERYLLKAISELQKYVNCEIIIKTEAKSEGGLKETLNIICDKSTIKNLLIPFIASFFRPAISKTDEIKNRVEIAEHIKDGNFSQEEAEILLSNDKTLKNGLANTIAP